jgi:predicted RNA binding protein YcfA (HicA-like mRNA interferase family)
MRLGCLEVRQSGSHVILRCGTCQTVVPKHGGDIRPGTLRSIERDVEPCLGKGWLR